MSSSIRLFDLLIILIFQIWSVYAFTDGSDASALQAVKSVWTNFPKNWKGSDPCEAKWVGIKCENNRITSISLGNLNLEGILPADISKLSELQNLDLTSNHKLSGPIPTNIGNLKKLTKLNLMECNFSGQIPDSIGDLQQLTRLSLNSNQFNGTIPASIGRLSNLDWFDISDNSIEGPLPVSDGTSPGLDMLLRTKHFHFGNNMLSGNISEELFSSNMTLIHILFNGNQFTGKIPESVSLIKSLQVLRLDRNGLSGEIPSSLNSLTNLTELHLANNRLTGSLPSLTNLTTLYTLDVSNNRFTSSPIPSWISSLGSLSTLRMEGIQLNGSVPSSLFSPFLLQTVSLKRNYMNGALDLGTNFSKQLESVDLRNNDIVEYKPTANNHIQVMLADNDVCFQVKNKLSDICNTIQKNSSLSIPQSNCGNRCKEGKELSSVCHCVYPLTGKLVFRSPSFSGYSNDTNFKELQESIEDFLKKNNHPVDSVTIKNMEESPIDYHLLIDLLVFPLGKERFNETEMQSIISVFSIHSYNPPTIFGPYVFNANPYLKFSEGSNSLSIGIIIGVSVGAAVLLLCLALAGIYALRQKKRAEIATGQINPFAKWNSIKTNIDAPQLMGAKAFTLEELKKCTDNFSKENDVGGGGYGQVYKGVLPSGQVIAIKRAQQGSSQGELEFKTEIELLSRVHHKNVVKLLGFCFDRNEQMLVYEYIPNGSLRDSLSGKNGIRLDWTRRLKIALGSAKGLAYLHELADPPIIHRDVKSNNILLDEHLTAKVADFGLSKLVGDPEKIQETTQVKGTMGYLDPEYYMTNQLTEKSDVYGFGVVMLELITGKSPIDKGSYVVKEVKKKMDKTRTLYDLQELLDTTIIDANNLKGFERFVDLALTCVETEGDNRPSMSEVVQEIDNIVKLVGLNLNAYSATSSRTYDDAGKGSGDPYGKEAFQYSGNFPSSES